MIEDIAEKIANLQIKHPLVFIGVFVLITLLLIPGTFNLVGNVEPSLEKVLPQDVEEVETMNNMRVQFGADMMYILVHVDGPINDVRNPELVKYIDTLIDMVKTRDYILEVNSINDLVKQSNNDVIPESFYEIEKSLMYNPMTKQFVNDDYSLAIIKIRSDTGASAQLIKKVVDDIREDIEISQNFNPGARLEVTGFNAIDKATFEVIIKDFMSITMVSMALVMLVVWITFKKFTKGMLPMVVVMVALIWTMGLAGYIGFTITVVSMVAAAMIMGLGIDFGIHQVHTYFSLREKNNPKDSLRGTLKELLRAMLGASLTTSAGFLALLFGVLPAMKTLGIILAMGIMTTLIGSIFLLPVIVYIYDGGLK